MQTSLLVARILAIIYLAVGLGMIFNKAYYQKMIHDLCSESPMLYIGGFLAIVAGFLLTTFHNIWVKDWTVLITIIGWLAMIKGIMLLVLPKTTITIIAKSFVKPNLFPLWNGFILLLGLVMGYFGFVA